MKILKPSAELIVQKSMTTHVAQCARICTNSKGTDDAKLIKNLIDSNHLSMFRHASRYYIVPKTAFNTLFLRAYIHCPYIEIRDVNNEYYIATNEQFIMENGLFERKFVKYEVSPKMFGETETGHKMLRYTIKIVTQISTSRELNRVSPNNIAERSTRYVYDNGTIVIPHWFDIEGNDIDFNISPIYDIAIDGVKYTLNELIKDDKFKCSYKDKSTIINYLYSCEHSFEEYNTLIKRCNMLRQDARGVMPLDTATICIYTYSVKEWANILNLRYYGTTGAPHPNAKIIGGKIREILAKQGYEFYAR